MLASSDLTCGLVLLDQEFLVDRRSARQSPSVVQQLCIASEVGARLVKRGLILEQRGLRPAAG